MKKLVKLQQHLRQEPFWFVVVSIAAASSVSLIGGLGLELAAERLIPLVPLIVALPALNTMVGDYATVIAAHAGDPNERTRSRRELAQAISVSVLINIIGVLLLSILIAWSRGFVFTGLIITKFVIFVPLAIISIVFFMFSITYFVDKIFEKRKLNPDEVLIPIVTSISDVLMLGAIAAAAWWLF